MLNELINLLAWALLPVAVITLVDDLWLRPRRRAAALPAAIQDPVWLRVLYHALPVLVVAAVVRILRSERFDFSLLLMSLTAIGAVIWLIDAKLLRPGRQRRTTAVGMPATALPEPAIVDYARSMVPVVAVVLVLRSFLFEPFRIPSDSMMPTLQDGDFILVNKFVYGLRLPVLHKKFMPGREPKRGEVVVFRYPPDPAVNYIKRLVGLPGDRIEIRDDQILINGDAVQVRSLGLYNDGCYENMTLLEETLGERSHQVLSCKSPLGIVGPQLPSCNRRLDRGYRCETAEGLEGLEGMPDSGDNQAHLQMQIPPGHYLMIGDNRDNSADGRVWGLVPEANLVGSASFIWFNWDLQRTGGPNWSRIGNGID